MPDDWPKAGGGVERGPADVGADQHFLDVVGCEERRDDGMRGDDLSPELRGQRAIAGYDQRDRWVRLRSLAERDGCAKSRLSATLIAAELGSIG
jgi:hypothetical protein